jgi:hypothetical protein
MWKVVQLVKTVVIRDVVKINVNKPSPNGRFCEMAAVAPQKRQCELGSYYPAGNLVKPPPRKAAGTLSASGRQRSGQRSENRN